MDMTTQAAQATRAGGTATQMEPGSDADIAVLAAQQRMQRPGKRGVAALKKLVLAKAIEAGRAYEAYSAVWRAERVQYDPDNHTLPPKVDVACKASNKASEELRDLSRELARALDAQVSR